MTVSTWRSTGVNPRGGAMLVAISIVMVPMTLVVAMRLWGRYRYRQPKGSWKQQVGGSHVWMCLSDMTIVLSYTIAVALTIVCSIAVRWGEGLHAKNLSLEQIQMVAKMFYVYQILYKFLSGIAKIATLFLLLAISTPHMNGFNIFCKLFSLFIGLYCVATSLVTVFQCGTDFASNWDRNLDQSRCFYLPPFWFAHAGINIMATAVMTVLPWWLFAGITYKRKHLISTIMCALAIGETVLGVVRLYGLYRSSRSGHDISYGTVTGILVSQLEVDFACISACVPTVLRMTEEGIYRLRGILGCSTRRSGASPSESSYSHMPAASSGNSSTPTSRSIERSHREFNDNEMKNFEADGAGPESPVRLVT